MAPAENVRRSESGRQPMIVTRADPADAFVIRSNHLHVAEEKA
jgi:hypothetical protein